MSKKPKPAAKIQRHYEVVRAYGPWSVGHVFTGMQPNQAGVLINRGLIKEVAAKVLQAPANRMLVAEQDLLGGRTVTRA